MAQLSVARKKPFYPPSIHSEGAMYCNAHLLSLATCSRQDRRYATTTTNETTGNGASMHVRQLNLADTVPDSLQYLSGA